MSIQTVDDRQIVIRKRQEYIIGLFKDFSEKHNLIIKGTISPWTFFIYKDSGKVKKRWFKKPEKIYINILDVSMYAYLYYLKHINIKCYHPEYEDLFTQDFNHLPIEFVIERSNYEKIPYPINFGEGYKITKC
ncbi:MAG: hypothetical protein ACXW1A_05435 [Nitrososphaeraceae archaeon]